MFQICNPKNLHSLDPILGRIPKKCYKGSDFFHIKNTIRSFQVFLYLVIWKYLMQILLLSWMIKNYK